MTTLGQIRDKHSDALGVVKSEHRKRLKEDEIKGARFGATNDHMIIKGSRGSFPNPSPATTFSLPSLCIYHRLLDLTTKPSFPRLLTTLTSESWSDDFLLVAYEQSDLISKRRKRGGRHTAQPNGHRTIPICLNYVSGAVPCFKQYPTASMKSLLLS